MVRYGQLIGLKPGKLAEYKRYHARVWPEVLATITDCNIRNYSIFHRDGQLFATSSTSARISRPTWRRWPPTRRPRSGGPS